MEGIPTDENKIEIIHYTIYSTYTHSVAFLRNVKYMYLLLQKKNKKLRGNLKKIKKFDLYNIMLWYLIL